jgi:hypothetical protein
MSMKGGYQTTDPVKGNAGVRPSKCPDTLTVIGMPYTTQFNNAYYFGIKLPRLAFIKGRGCEALRYDGTRFQPVSGDIAEVATEGTTSSARARDLGRPGKERSL